MMCCCVSDVAVITGSGYSSTLFIDNAPSTRLSGRPRQRQSVADGTSRLHRNAQMTSDSHNDQRILWFITGALPPSPWSDPLPHFPSPFSFSPPNKNFFPGAFPQIQQRDLGSDVNSSIASTVDLGHSGSEKRIWKQAREKVDII